MKIQLNLGILKFKKKKGLNAKIHASYQQKQENSMSHSNWHC